ncbi:hypothetical protein [Streptomyces sp. TRM70350]|uniref:hypothetical protein n=1 Tax=Streptomyces sp. TRM70350 TaxID=2856165 RepID=UPI001C443FD4|nr:hypothetical protein [Streptomyces sp. TRM70350]MBV7699576.1 hypothetical protein [Streptomyces sp. TRM70350]
MEDASLTREIGRVNQHTRSMISEYVAWGGKIRHGEVHYALYDEMLEFVNLRTETADSCLTLIGNRKIADSLGLSRSLLEHYLLFMLMCRGRKYFRLQDLSNLTKGQFNVRLRKEQEELEAKRAAGTSQRIAVRKYPRAPARHLMHIFEGLKDKEDPDFVIPIHYFQFQQFRPEVMRLNDEDYFQYYPRPEETKKALEEHQRGATFSYRHYLAYDALLQSLELNDLVDSAAIARIEAHYTFLGKFLHPTHGAARELRERSNIHYGGTGVGIGQDYSQLSVLLASLYVCYSLAGLFGEAVALLEGAPSKYVADAGTSDLRALIDSVPRSFPYFWFLFNDPPLFDCFNYCVHHASEQNLAEWGHYSNVPKARVPFDQNIYTHLERSLGTCSNSRWGMYYSPIG